MPANVKAIALFWTVVAASPSLAQEPGVGRFGAIAPIAEMNGVKGVMLILNTYAPKDGDVYDVVVYVQAKSGRDESSEWEYVRADDSASISNRSSSRKLIGVSRISGKSAVAAIFIPHSSFELSKGVHKLQFIASFYARSRFGAKEIKALEKVVGGFSVKVEKPRVLRVQVFGDEVPPVQLHDYQRKVP